MKKTRKGPKDPLERSIWMRENVIRRAYTKIDEIRADAELEVQRVEKEIQKKKVLLDALKRGKLSA